MWILSTRDHKLRSFGVIRTLWVLLAVSWPSFLAAQQPFYTDDADVTPAGKVHIEAFDEYDWLQRGQRPHIRQNTVNMRVNWGLGKGLEVDLDSPLLTIVNDATVRPLRAFGIGDTNFGVKYNLRPEQGKSPAVSFAMYIETPTGNPRTGLGSGLTDIWAYCILQKTLSPSLVARINGGYLFTGNTSTGVVGITTARGHVATTGASITRMLTRRLNVGAEATAAVAPNSDLQRAQLQFLAGGNYELREGLTLDIGILGGHYIASPRFGLQIGFSFDYR